MPLIPPLLVDNKFVIDMKTKANIFNEFSAVNLLENYLSGRFQRFILNRQNLMWRPVLVGVPQG